MTDQLRGRARRDDSLVPLLTVLVVVAAFGPAAYAAARQWLVPRLDAGRDAVSVSFADWWGQNWWLVVFWVLELSALLGFLAWSRRRQRRRSRQMDSVVAGLAQAMPADFEPRRDVRVLRWNGHRPVRLRIQLTPRSPMDDPVWRGSLAEAAGKVLGRLEPIAWPRPPRSGVFDWAVRPPRVELRVATGGTEERQSEPLDSPEIRTPERIGGPAEDLQIYRRPRSGTPDRVTAEHGSASTRLDRED